jgi:hypothetical protein
MPLFTLGPKKDALNEKGPCGIRFAHVSIYVLSLLNICRDFSHVQPHCTFCEQTVGVALLNGIGR